MNQQLEVHRETIPAIRDGEMRDPVTLNLVSRDLLSLDTPAEMLQAASKHSTSEPTIASLMLALAHSESHLADVLHHNQRLLANHAHLQELVLERTRDMQEAQRVASHDELTGLQNQRMLTERLRTTIAFAEKNDQPVALILLALDGFRHDNDRLRRKMDDVMLCAIARRIAMNVRSFDTVCRYRGDEFVLILPNQDRGDAVLTIEKVLQQIAALSGLDGQAVNLIAFTGVAVYPRDGSNPDELLEAAENALHRHKSHPATGRKPNIFKRWFMNAKSGRSIA